MEIGEDWIAGKRYVTMDMEGENENEKRIYRKMLCNLIIKV